MGTECGIGTVRCWVWGMGDECRVWVVGCGVCDLGCVIWDV